MAIHIYRSIAYWSESDAAGIVHFTNFFRYCERAEEDFWLSRYGGLDEARNRFNILFPRVRAECNFHYPIYPYDRFRVEITEVLIGNSSITYKFSIYNESRDDKLSGECILTVVCVDRLSMKSISIPMEIRDFLISNGARER
ncbi:MAG TPA: acyl-CoA thioesterase [Thermoprotei archaeon]|nr:acyl-CoA thioesterase [Thermoprotei archaeon]